MYSIELGMQPHMLTNACGIVVKYCLQHIHTMVREQRSFSAPHMKEH